MLSINTCYKKGIFWCFKETGGFFGDDYYGVYRPIVVHCDAKGNALEELKSADRDNVRILHPKAPEYSSKSGDNFNHKIEWEKYHDRLPFDYYPRGRIEVRNSKIKIFASTVIVASEEYREAVCQAFQYRPNRKDITWIADNSAHYRYTSEEWCGKHKNELETEHLSWWFDDEFL